MSGFYMGEKIKVIVQEGATLPRYETEGAAGADICAFVSQPITLKVGGRVAVPTGLFFEIPRGFEVQIRPRSGLALKNGITCLNTPGTIDSDYRGEVKVILANFGDDDFVIQNGMRIAQMIFAPVLRCEFSEVSSLEETARGSGGFGSTGMGENL